MEFLNRIELRGVVGRADCNAFNNHHVCNFSVVTEASIKDREGNSVSEPTWFNVTAWDGVQGLDDVTRIQKGMWVNVIGRLRHRKYTTQDNEDRYSLDILARLVKILPKEDLMEQMQPQRDY